MRGAKDNSNYDFDRRYYEILRGHDSERSADSDPRRPLSVKEFVALITDPGPDPAKVAAFARAITGKARSVDDGDSSTPRDVFSEVDWDKIAAWRDGWVELRRQEERRRVGGNRAYSAAPALRALHEYNPNWPNEPRDERGRWTTGGSSGVPTVPTGFRSRLTQSDLDAMVDKFKKLKDGKALCDRAEKAAKANGAAGLTLKIEPPENLPPDAEAASDLQHGQIGIRDDLSDAKMLESIIIELSNIARTSALDALDKDITKMTRDAYIEAVERVEFQSVKDTAAIWKAVAKEFGQDPADCPTYGNTDDVANLDFKTFFDQVRRSHKEFNGRKWDDANST